MYETTISGRPINNPSMKVPPKRKGNATPKTASPCISNSLNESPSEKEGKLRVKPTFRTRLRGPQ